MNASYGSLRTFLVTARNTLQNALKNKNRITFVIGNESADLDSITSSIVYAYLRSHSLLRSAARSSSSPESARIYVPLLNLRQEDVDIRPELLALLPHANIEKSHLITLDDLAADSPTLVLAPEDTRWILVDHNALQGELGKKYSNRVVGCIDHHDEEGKVPKDTDGEPRIIEKCGSCSSLVVNHCKGYWSELTSDALISGASHGQDDASVGGEDASMRKTWNVQVAKLALASIVIDTNNLKSKDKTTKADTDAVKYIHAMLDLGKDITFDQEKFFMEINSAKHNLDSLAVKDILRKDYKQWTQKGDKILGISSVVEPLSYLINKAGKEVTGGASSSAEAFNKCLQEFAKERSLGVYAIMTTSKSPSGEFQRELLIQVLDPTLESLKDKIAKEATEALGLEQWQEEKELRAMESANKDEQPMQVWWQRKTEHSRKQVAPLLRRLMQ